MNVHDFLIPINHYVVIINDFIVFVKYFLVFKGIFIHTRLTEHSKEVWQVCRANSTVLTQKKWKKRHARLKSDRL